MYLTVEIFHNGEWHEAATVELREEERGFMAPSSLDYEMQYFVDFAAVEFSNGAESRDDRAVSLRHPVNLANQYKERWPSFLLDLMPQGHARRRLARHLNIDEESRVSDTPLLMRGASNPVGNIRIKEAADAERERLRDIVRVGVSEQEIFDRTERFNEVVDRFGMLASGSSGLQGEWPKIAMTLTSDGLYYPDAFVRDDEAVRHTIVKLLRSNDEQDRLILEAEAVYSRLAQVLGLKVFEPSVYKNGVLMIARFDRLVRNRQVERVGQESFVSAIGVSDFGHNESHETYIEAINRHSTEPFDDVVEYMKREIANQALGNPDNHGRNTAFSKYGDGTVRISPLFDFAPMKLSREGIVRSTRWNVMRASHRDTNPDWKAVCDAIFPDPQLANRLMSEIACFAAALKNAPQMAIELGATGEVVERAMGRCVEIAEAVIEAA